ncbi:hypothetical protein [Actinomyces massiliensis]|jgi:hypothetical protein mintA_09676|uniref:hypothetical protein n=1 Tax=Actinomyces massiliensis TaxID=461393 RepID=UPI0012B5DD8C|nr:hypothetical protein [Actinomyces massiliensis]
MTIETDIPGDAAGIMSLGSWLTANPGGAVTGAGDAFADAKSLIGSEWEGATADAFISSAGRSVQDCDDLGELITSTSSAITDYGCALKSVQEKMSGIRAQAAAQGLTVSGTTISMPTDVNASDQSKLNSAYEDASVQAADARRAYTEAKSTLQSLLPQGQGGDKSGFGAEDAGNIYKLFSIAFEGGSKALVGTASIIIGRSVLQQGGKLISDAARLSDAVLKDPIGFGGAKFANEALNHAGAMKNEGNNIVAKMAKEGAKFKVEAPSFLAKAGKRLPLVGLAVGTGVDLANGESPLQAGVSNTAATVVGVGAGGIAEAGSTILASAALGAAGGSVVPGVGTAVGLAAGFVAGTAAAIFTDKTVDSMMEDHQGVGHAMREGGEAVKDTACDIGKSVWKGAKWLAGAG